MRKFVYLVTYTRVPIYFSSHLENCEFAGLVELTGLRSLQSSRLKMHLSFTEMSHVRLLHVPVTQVPSSTCPMTPTQTPSCWPGNTPNWTKGISLRATNSLKKVFPLLLTHVRPHLQEPSTLSTSSKQTEAASRKTSLEDRSRQALANWREDSVLKRQLARGWGCRDRSSD